MTFSSRPQLSIFNIPHILDQICDELSKDQLLVCLDVSRTWRVLFTAQALRHVRFSNLKSHQTRTILSRASLIRSLTIDISDAGWFLNNPTVVVPPFNSLRELHCVDFNYRPKPKPARRNLYTHPSIVDQSENALLLIVSSPKLHTLTVDNISRLYMADHFTETVFNSLYTHTSLTKIKIRLPCAPLGFSNILFNSLPDGLRDFELSIGTWGYLGREYYPVAGYLWQQKKQEGEARVFSAVPSLRHLERLVLGEWYSRPSSGLLAEEGTEKESFIIDQVIPSPIDAICFDMVKTYSEWASGLQHLAIKDYLGSWSRLLQLLLDNCTNLETIKLSSSSYGYNIDTTGASVQFRGSFVALREFRIASPMSEQIYIAISKLVVQSSSTLEVLWLNLWNYDRLADEITNPFHIGTATSWTRCKRLKELCLYLEGGALLTDPCWDIYPSFSVFEATKDYGTVFAQLEKLRLGVKEPLWQECPDRYHVGDSDAGYYSWDAFDYENDYYGYFDENDHYHYFDESYDEEWRPLKDYVSRTNEAKIQGREKKQAERLHQRAFILQVRELFGRLKDIKQLRELEIEWVVCSSIRDMSVQLAMELFKETEAKDYSGSIDQGDGANSSIRTSKGWWGQVTREDLIWLCLPWTAIQSSGIHPTLIKAAARQYENKSQLPGCCDDTNGRCDHEMPPWSTGDIYKARVGRVWKDWLYVSYGDHPYRMGSRGYIYRYWDSYQDYPSYDLKHTMNSHDFEVFVEGNAENREEALWGKKKATRGEDGRYRQKAIGKRNQRK
ncbi:hypothetical protein BGW39_001534 [Mortierella sp. 14UC]|nr:hypothetical protein BGW39_001534 [Mortierella sp. 14UC]